MPDAKISDLPAGGDPQDTDEFVVARGATNVSLAWSSLSNAATRNNVAVTLDGNTAGVLALVSTGTLTLAGGNNITVSQAGNAVTISGANVGGAQTGISGLANSEATYTSGTVELVNTGAITIASGPGQQFIFSVDPQSVQPETQTFIGGISASDTLYTSGSVRFSGSQAATVRSGTGQLVIIDVPTQSVQPETQTFIGGISASDTLYTSGTVRFTGVGGGITVSTNTGQRIDLSVAAPIAATNLSVGVSTGGNTSGDTGVNTGSRFVIVGSNGITASQGTAAGATTITLSGITQSIQTQGVLSIGVSSGGNTAGNTTVNTGSRFVLVASGNATASQATAAGASTVTISVGTQTVQTQGVPLLGVSTGGNTSGDTGVASGTRFVLVGGNNITLSQGTAANATTVTISAGAGGAGLSAGMSTLGNTSGDTGYASQRLNLVGGNNITLSGSTDAGSMSITISAPNLGAGAFSGGASNLGNTAGSTGVTGTRFVFVGTNNISLSQSTDANGGTLSFNNTVSNFSGGVSTGGNTAGSTGVTGTRMVYAGTGDVTLSQSTDANGGTITFRHTYLSSYDANYAKPRASAAALASNRLYMQPYMVPLAFVHDQALVGVHYTQATNSTLTVSVSLHLGFYTRNGASLEMASSTSHTMSINGSGTASSLNNSGIRYISVPWTNTVPAGQYWLGFVSRTSTAGNNATLNNMVISQINSAYSGLMGVASGATNQQWLGIGIHATTQSTLTTSMGFTALDGGGSANVRPQHIWFLSGSV